MAIKKHQVAIEITGSSADLNRTLRQSSTQLRTFERHVASVGQRLRRARQSLTGGGVMGRGGGMLRGALGFAGVFGFQQLLQETKNFEEGLSKLMVQGNKSLQWMSSARKQLLGVSNATGLSKNATMAYVSAIIEQTGNADFAVKTLRDMGEVAVATGADMASLGDVMVQLSRNMRLGADDTKAAWDIFRTQEKMGSVTVQNMATQFGKLSGIAPLLGKGGMGLTGISALGGLMQITARGFGREQIGEAGTATQRFLEFLTRNPEKIEKLLGADIGRMGKKGFEFLDLPTVFRNIGTAAAADPGKMAKYGQQLFGMRGVRTVQQLMAASKQGWATAGAPMFGVTGRTGEIEKDAAKVRQTAAYKWNQAIARMSNTLHTSMLPALEAAVELMPRFAKMLKWALENSEMLIKLWLGWKGAKLIQALMAPVGGRMGAAGVAGAAICGRGGAPVPGVIGPQPMVAGPSRGALVGRGILTATAFAEYSQPLRWHLRL
ncbi:MAG: phage tail tape measure protein [Planctomycetota bacterium]|jgi:hypothetical protein